MKILKSVFKILAEGGKPPHGYQKIRYHIVFDIKKEDFTRKAILVASGHVTEPPYTMMYANLVLIDTVSISLKVAALNFFK